VTSIERKTVQREILLSFWKVHILYHAEEGGVVGQWMIEELRHHGYHVSPGTIYPILKRMERNGWLRCRRTAGKSANAAQKYSITAKGKEILQLVRTQLAELQREVLADEIPSRT